MTRTKPSAMTGTAELNAMIERVAPDVLALLADGVPRTRAAIVEALASRHDRQDVALALIRLAVTGRAVETGGRYTLTAAEMNAGRGRVGDGADGRLVLELVVSVAATRTHRRPGGGPAEDAAAAQGAQPGPRGRADPGAHAHVLGAGRRAQQGREQHGRGE
jgi:hypothetical protein